jgi:flavocytochrome c
MVEWDEYVDVVVVGSGLAGLAAAIEARKAGASVVVFEKMPVTGGNTRISDGGLAAPNNYLQRQRGITDSPELFYNDIMKAGLGLNHPELVRIVADRAADTIEWTRSELGVDYLDRLDRFGGHSAARCLTTRSHSGVDIIKPQVFLLRDMGVEIRTRCRLKALVTEKDGAVGGVTVRPSYRRREHGSGSDVNVRAIRAVVLATGGFSSDTAFRKLHDPFLDGTIGTTNQRGATSEGLIAALKIGAAPVHLSHIQTGPWACPDEPGYGRGGRFASYGVYPAGILVDPATGLRIVNEWGSRKERSDAIIRSGHPCVGIVDKVGAKKDARSLQHCLKTRKVKQFEDIIGLASAYDIPRDALLETVADYKRRITENAPDPFGKPLDQGILPLNHPPFYAIRLWPKVHYTPGGVRIDTRARVLDLSGRPIPRLFAAGEVCGGVHGASRLGSVALTECLVFGRIAGREAAAQSPKALSTTP